MTQENINLDLELDKVTDRDLLALSMMSNINLISAVIKYVKDDATIEKIRNMHLELDERNPEFMDDYMETKQFKGWLNLAGEVNRDE